MKKLMFGLGLSLISVSLYAACMGPFCWDDRGASVGGFLQDGNGAGLPSANGLTITTMCPRAAGQEIYCSSCSMGLQVCVSTSTTCNASSANNFDYVNSTGTVCK